MKDFLLFDLGGASVELTLVQEGEPVHSVSIPIGAVTVTEKFNLQGNVDAIALQDCLKFVRKKLLAADWIKNLRLPLVGIGGTARTFAKMDQRTTNYELTKVHNYILPAEHFDALYTEITTRTSANRKKIPGLSSERADLIVAGAAVIKTLFDTAGSPELVVSGCGLREGLFFEYYTSYFHLPAPRFDDILKFSIRNFVGTLGGIVNESHCQQVTHTAGLLFDQLKDLHGYGERERLYLTTAAQLHDVGKIINFYDHARHSAFMIGHAPLYGLTQREQLIASFIAGFHHASAARPAGLPLRQHGHGRRLGDGPQALHLPGLGRSIGHYVRASRPGYSRHHCGKRRRRRHYDGSRRSLQRGGLRNEPADQAIQKGIRHLPAPRLEVSL